MQFKLINTRQGFDDMAEEWNALLNQSQTNTPFLRHEYLSAWYKTLGGGEWQNARLAIIAAYENSQLIGLAPFFLTDNEGKEKLHLLGGVEISDYLDLIIRAGNEQTFIAGLLDFLAAQPGLEAWSAIQMFNLPETSSTLPILKSEALARGLSVKIEPFRPAVSVPLTGDFDSYLAGIDKKQRHEIRRKIRRAEAYEKPVRWYIVNDAARLDDEIDAFLVLMAQDHHKEEFLTEVMRSQMRTSVHAAFRSGWLQLAFLEVDGQKAAGYLNFDYADRIWVYNSGLDFSFRELSPGWVLLGYLLQWANENGKTEFDFMRGDEDYKFKFGGKQRQVMKIRIEK